MTGCLFLLCALGAAAAVPVARALDRAVWPEREPVLGLWVWQCLVVTVLLSGLAALGLCAAAAFRSVREQLIDSVPSGVATADKPSFAPVWVTALAVLLAAGAAWTAAALARQFRVVRRARREARARLAERAPELPTGLPACSGPLLVLEEESPGAWWLPGSPSRLVVTTGALRRLTDRQLDAVLTHERSHARARHDWLMQLSAALAVGFAKVPLFVHFCERTHRLVELAADDTAARRCGHVTTALALIELNRHRGVFSRAVGRRLLADRVDRLLAPPPRLVPWKRTLIATAAAAAPLMPPLIAFASGIEAPG
ncbi:M56 family metallopeptidase [Streptomyces sp. NPDC001919]